MIGKQFGAVFLALISNASVVVADVPFVCNEERPNGADVLVDWGVAPDAIAFCKLGAGQGLDLYESPSTGEYRKVSGSISEGPTHIFIYDIVRNNETILLETRVGMTPNCDDKILRYTPSSGMICVFHRENPQ